MNMEKKKYLRFLPEKTIIRFHWNGKDEWGEIGSGKDGGYYFEYGKWDSVSQVFTKSVARGSKINSDEILDYFVPEKALLTACSRFLPFRESRRPDAVMDNASPQYWLNMCHEMYPARCAILERDSRLALAIENEVLKDATLIKMEQIINKLQSENEVKHKNLKKNDVILYYPNYIQDNKEKELERIIRDQMRSAGVDSSLYYHSKISKIVSCFGRITIKDHDGYFVQECVSTPPNKDDTPTQHIETKIFCPYAAIVGKYGTWTPEEGWTHKPRHRRGNSPTIYGGGGGG